MATVSVYLAKLQLTTSLWSTTRKNNYSGSALIVKNLFQVERNRYPVYTFIEWSACGMVLLPRIYRIPDTGCRYHWRYRHQCGGVVTHAQWCP